VDEVGQGHRHLAVLNVLLHLALKTGVGVNDIPLARQSAQFGLEGGVGVVLRINVLGLARVLVLGNLLLVINGLNHGDGLFDRVDFESIVDQRIDIGVGDLGDLLGVNRAGVHGLGEGVEGGFELLLVFAG
jgi:hypothetical protein